MNNNNDDDKALTIYNNLYNNNFEKKEIEIVNQRRLTTEHLDELNKITQVLKNNLLLYDGILQEVQFYIQNNDKSVDENVAKMTIVVIDDVKIYNYIVKGIVRGKLNYKDGISKIKHCFEKIVKTLTYISTVVTININNMYMHSEDLKEIDSLACVIECNFEHKSKQIVNYFIKLLTSNIETYDYILKHLLYNQVYHGDDYLQKLLYNLHLEMKKFNAILSNINDNNGNFNDKQIVENSFLNIIEKVVKILYSIGFFVTSKYNEVQLQKNYNTLKVSELLFFINKNIKF